MVVARTELASDQDQAEHERDGKQGPPIPARQEATRSFNLPPLLGWQIGQFGEGLDVEMEKHRGSLIGQTEQSNSGYFTIVISSHGNIDWPSGPTVFSQWCAPGRAACLQNRRRGFDSFRPCSCVRGRAAQAL